MPVVMFFLPPARSDGLVVRRRPAVGRCASASPRCWEFCILAFVSVRRWRSWRLSLLAIAVALMARLSSKQIGGQTGDVLGAVEQVSEIVILLVALR